jgi:hypothetical protein
MQWLKLTFNWREWACSWKGCVSKSNARRVFFLAKDKDIKQLNIELRELLNTKARQTKLLEEESKSIKGNNDHLTNGFEKLNSLVDSLRNSSKENYELVEL